MRKLLVVLLLTAVPVFASNLNLTVSCSANPGYNGCAYGEFGPPSFGVINFADGTKLYTGLTGAFNTTVLGGWSLAGYVQIMNPSGDTFSGLLTSGEAFAADGFVFSENMSADFYGRWNTGTYAKGSFDISEITFGPQSPQFETGDLQTQSTPEPSSLVLLGCGLGGIALWRYFS